MLKICGIVDVCCNGRQTARAVSVVPAFARPLVILRHHNDEHVRSLPLDRLVNLESAMGYRGVPATAMLEQARMHRRY
jgi:hypothetical protein